jgi:hypothetical protein
MPKRQKTMKIDKKELMENSKSQKFQKNSQKIIPPAQIYGFSEVP